MQLHHYLVVACVIMAHSNYKLQAAYLANDAQALAYCKQTEDTHVVIVWPQGYDHLNYIVKTLNQHGSVKYVKKLVLNKKQIFSLYRSLHTSMSYKSAKKYFKPYSTAFPHEQLHIVALVFHTKAKLEKVVQLKKTIRDHIGASYYALHINDYYDPGTVQAAYAVFKAIPAIEDTEVL